MTDQTEYAYQRAMIESRNNRIQTASISARKMAEEISFASIKEKTIHESQKVIPCQIKVVDPQFVKYNKIERSIGIDFLKNFRRSVEIMLNDTAQRYINDVMDELVMCGLFKHNLKKCANRMKNVGKQIQMTSRSFDEAQVRGLCTAIYPDAIDEYIECGGTITGRMQAAFYHKFGKAVTFIWYGTKNLMDKYNISHSQIATNIQMVSMIGNIAADLYMLTSNHIDKLSGMKCESYTKNVQANELISCSHQLLIALCNKNVGVEIKEEDVKPVRDQVRQLTRQLTDKPMQELRESCMVSLLQEYIEFSIAFMRMKIENGSIGIYGIKYLFYRLGTRKNVEMFINELKAIPPKSNEDDMFDYIKKLPNTPKEGSAIGDFRIVCIKGTRLESETETNEEKELRGLRREVYANPNDELSLHSMKCLFRRFGTKKATMEYLAKAGSTLDKSIRKFKRLKVSELTY